MKPKPTRWHRRALIGLGACLVAVPALWLAIHEIPGFGPALADGVRALVGPAPVAWAENVAYGIEDRINTWRYEGAPPKTFWEPTAPGAGESPTATLPAHAIPSSADAKSTAYGNFPPPSIAPPYDKVAGADDGRWLPIASGSAGPQASAMAKTVLHPDPKRSFAAVAIVAVDLRRLGLHLRAGTSEPISDAVPPERRSGLVPKEDANEVMAAFNGGFKAIHGHYGMMIGGETYLPPRKSACTIAMYKDGLVRIQSWPKIDALKASAAQMVAYRQTPPCLVEEGEVNSTLESNQYNRSWGSTVSGNTVIRRSAVGVDKTGSVLFYALGEAVTARTLARALKAIGAESAAQLDVNYAYPRFLLYERVKEDEPPRAVSSLIPGIEFTGYEYVTNASDRDFFYLTPRKPSS